MKSTITITRVYSLTFFFFASVFSVFSSVSILNFQNVTASGVHSSTNPLTFYEINNTEYLEATISVTHPTLSTGTSGIIVVAQHYQNSFETILNNSTIINGSSNTIVVRIEKYRKWEIVKEGTLRFQVTYQNGIIETSNYVYIIRKSLSLLIEGSERDGKIILSNCKPNIYLKGKAHIDPNVSANYTLEFQEIDYTPQRNSIGNKFTKNLTSSEVSQLNSGTLSLVNLIAGSNVSLTNLKRYRVYLIANNSNGLWLDNTNYFVFKNGKWELMIRDNWDYQPLANSEWWDGDLGEEYNNASATVFNSNDIWNRLSNNSGWNTNTPPIVSRIGDTKHENPDFSTTNSNYLYTKINNIGCDDKPLNNAETVSLRMFWTRARLGEKWNVDWLYDLNNNGINYLDPSLGIIVKVPLGSEITIQNPTSQNPYNNISSPKYFTPLSVPTQSGYILSGCKWYAPNKQWYDASNGSMSGNGDPVLCFLSRFSSPSEVNADPIVWEQIPTNNIEVYVRQNNNVATRNVHLMDDPNWIVNPNPSGYTVSNFATVIANNPSENPTRICFKNISEQNSSVNSITNYAEIQIGLTNGIWNNWVLNGMQGSGFSVLSNTLLMMTNPDSLCLDSITIGDNLNEQIGVRLKWNNNAIFPDSTIYFNYVFSQTNSEGFPYYHGSDAIISMPVSPIEPENYIQNGSSKNNTNLNSLGPFDKIEYTLYPNPTSNKAVLSIINLGYESNKILELYDVTGKLILTNSIFNNKGNIGYFEINTDQLSKGLYFIKVIYRNSVVINEKLVLE